nr:hypothetical protein GCM10020093_054870 [Planobispora longispora]
MVIPGLVDGHLHPVSGAELTQGLDLSGCADLDAVREALAREVRTLAPGAWLHAWGLDPNVFGDRPVETAALAPVLDGVPALLQLFDAHSMLASARALELAGVDGPRAFAQAAEVVCDDAGRPTGLLLEDAACELVERAAPRPTRAERRARLAAALRTMAAAGLTGGHVMDANGESLALYAELDEAGELPLRLRVAPWCQPGVDADGLRALIEQQGTGGGLWRVEGVKLFMDGTIDNGTAWLERPDCHGESTHAFWPEPGAYTHVVGELHRAGVPTATHAIGDAAVRHVLDSVEKALTATGSSGKSTGSARSGTGSSTSRPSPTPPCAASPSSASSRPCSPPTAATSPGPTTPTTGRAGSARSAPPAPGAAATCGTPGPPSSSAPTGPSPPPPLGVMAGARHRRPSRDLTQPPHGPGQALTALEALQGMTLNPARAAGAEHEAGRLAVGCRADLTVLADDPLTTAATDLPDLPVLLTVLDGRPTHRDPGL